MILTMAMVMAIKQYSLTQYSNAIVSLSSILLLTLSSQINAAAQITTTKSIDFTQAIGSNKTDTEDTSINNTTISSNFIIDYTKAKLQLTADYSLIASNDNTENEDDLNHRLNLVTIYTHIPNEWTTNFTSQMFQRNLSDTAELISDPNAVSDATENYIINSINTSRAHSIDNNTLLTSTFNLTSQGFQDGATSKNASISFELNKNRISPSIGFNTSINSQENFDTNETNSSLSVTTNYFINTRLDTFLTITENQSNNDNFDESRYDIGLNWTLSTTNFINFGMGQFGEQNTWSIDSNITINRTSFTINHSEQVDTINQALVDNLATNAPNLTDPISGSLSFIKNTSLTISHRTRRTTFSLILTKIETFSDISSSSDRTSQNTALNINHQLNNYNSISYTYSHNTIKVGTANQLDEHSVNWSSQFSKRSSYNVELRLVEQDNELSEFDSKRNQINFNFNQQF